ncbi:LuxR C-terminal-related transcriptional regulator [Bailinhaonella thermotolerans]|uniref:DNA-binding response regulator n=1 Tax=Bailinhaonella thermotolerans TaxID=1070861 RepID=A0A3A4B5B0_9ACTN|nr:response regulator transcription factor [Bailinhaonella thermotolerans]RJL32602.1 DNA-binding response regulator [Bailinhaonella thermotolerans]
MIRVLLAEDKHMIRGALVCLLAREPGIEVVADVGRPAEIVLEAIRCRPDVAVLDSTGLGVAAELNERVPGCQTLILSGRRRRGMLRQALTARAAGLILKDAPPGHLADAIRRVAAGERVIDPSIAVAEFDAEGNPLKRREAQVLRLAAGGSDVPEIAARLHLSDGTVRNYLSAAVSRLGARNRLDAVRIATEAGWL